MAKVDLKLSCADSAFPKLSHPVALAVIQDLGISAVDVCVFAGYEHTPPDRVVADPVGTAAEVRRRLDDFGLVASDAFAILGAETFEDLAVNHPEAKVRDESMWYFERFLAFASHLGAPGVTILPGTTFEGVDPDASLELAAAELRRRAARAHAVGLPLSIEPHYGSVVQSPARTQELIDRAPEIQLTLDYSHFVYQGIVPGEVHCLLKHVRHFHVRPAAPRAIQTRVIDGTVEYQDIRDRLLAEGYDGWFALEYQWEEAWEPGGLDFTRVDCIAETAALRDLMLAFPNGE